MLSYRVATITCMYVDDPHKINILCLVEVFYQNLCSEQTHAPIQYVHGDWVVV